MKKNKKIIEFSYEDMKQVFDVFQAIVIIFVFLQNAPKPTNLYSMFHTNYNTGSIWLVQDCSRIVVGFEPVSRARIFRGLRRQGNMSSS
jgi:hypothetical protein